MHVTNKIEESLEWSNERSAIYSAFGLTPYLMQREVVKIGTLPIHSELYHHSAAAPCLLFIPGIGTYSEIYSESLAKLASRGFNVLSVDLRGHGYSGGVRGDYVLSQVISDLKLVLDYLQVRYAGDIAAVGCSIGSRIALALSEADSRVRALVCHTLFISEIAPDLYHSIGWNNLSIVARWVPNLTINLRTFVDINKMYIDLPEPFESHPMGKFALEDERMVWDYTVRTLDSVYNQPCRAYSTPLSIPAVIVVGELDTIVKPSYIRKLIDKVAHPFEYIELKQAGHVLPIETIEKWVDACDQWLKLALLDTKVA
ncbi:alpha/beta hydrolase [Vibrio sp. WXL103]|uniref:alpha/beta hydrolase n=1 Tax=Vibrio sp. WXL103 TaxID=3450710 RepID=UPI003EC6016C